MTATLDVTIEAWEDGATIPGRFAFCVPAAEGHVTMGQNLSPPVAWSGAPAGTQSFAVICHDPDVPSVPDDVNQEGRTIPAELPRVDFYHWVLVDIPASATGLAEGADSDGVTAGGKAPGPSAQGLRGINNFTDWFAGDEAMRGDYGGYDGPCPPWNDEILHHYHFRVYALDVANLGLGDKFGAPEALAAMAGHVLAQGARVGSYTLNPALG